MQHKKYKSWTTFDDNLYCNKHTGTDLTQRLRIAGTFHVEDWNW